MIFAKNASMAPKGFVVTLTTSQTTIGVSKIEKHIDIKVSVIIDQQFRYMDKTSSYMTSMEATKIKTIVKEDVPLGVHIFIEQSGQPGFCM